MKRLRAECSKLSEAAGGASNEAQLRMLQRIDRENKAYNATVVQKTVEVLGSIIERTGSTTSPLAVLPAPSDGSYRTGTLLGSVSLHYEQSYNTGSTVRRRSIEVTISDLTGAADSTQWSCWAPPPQWWWGITDERWNR